MSRARISLISAYARLNLIGKCNYSKEERAAHFLPMQFRGPKEKGANDALSSSGYKSLSSHRSGTNESASA